jgi:hypothetical protein
MFERRSFLAGLAAATLAPLVDVAPAEASTLYGLTLEDLVRRSNRISVGTSVEHSSGWTQLGGARRIVTLHRVVESRRLESDETPEECWVLTLGGHVGDLGQKVSGEAEIQDGAGLVMFLGEEKAGSSLPPYRRVVGMAQGAYGLVERAGKRVLTLNRDMPELIRPPHARLAVEELSQIDLESCASAVRRFR